MTTSILAGKTVANVNKLIIRTPAIIKAGAPVDLILAKIVENPGSRHVYVVDESGKLIGSIRLNVIVEYILPYAALTAKADRQFINLGYLNAHDIMDPAPFSVSMDTSLEEVLNLMQKTHINELPVVDRDMRIIGEINILELITGYLNAKGTRDTPEQ